MREETYNVNVQALRLETNVYSLSQTRSVPFFQMHAVGLINNRKSPSDY